MRQWKRQLGFLISDIQKNKLQFFIGLIQIGAALWILCYVLQLSFSARNTIEKISEFDQKQEIYQLTDESEGEQFEEMLNSSRGQKGLRAFYRYIKNLKNIKTFTADSSYFTEFSADQVKEAAELFETDDTEDCSTAKTLRVSSNFFDIFHLNGNFSESKVKQWFTKADSDENVPVILGNAFKKYYKKGDKLEDSGGRIFIVRGFLDEGESYIAPFENQYSTELDNYFLIPATVKMSEPDELISYITGTYFMTNDRSVMDKLIKKSEESGLIPFSYQDFHTQTKACMKEIKNQIMTMSAVMLLILVFASIGIVNYFIRLIQERAEEFAVHMLCGAKGNEILFRITAQLGVMVLISAIFLLWQYGIWIETVLTIILGFIYGAAVMVYPAVILKRQSIINIIRSSRS